MGDRIRMRISVYGEVQTPEAFFDLAEAIADMDEIRFGEDPIGTGELAVRQALLSYANMRAPLRLSGYVWDSRVPDLEMAVVMHGFKARIRAAGRGGHAPSVWVVERGLELKTLTENGRSEATLSCSDIDELRASGVCTVDELVGHLARYDDVGPDFSIADNVRLQVLNARQIDR